MRDVALFAIAGYQRYISPYKGYCCAYACRKGQPSCSEFGSRVISKYGIGRGLNLLNARLNACRVASMTSPGENRPRQKAEHYHMEQKLPEGCKFCGGECAGCACVPALF
jgi:putative component of membrane protein insertase Oxa1/YidC/SpoIIIJ protein YidD